MRHLLSETNNLHVILVLAHATLFSERLCRKRTSAEEKVCILTARKVFMTFHTCWEIVTL